MAKKKQTRKNSKSPNSKKYYALAGILLFVIVVAAGSYLLFPGHPKSTGVVTYNADIRPVLQQKCVNCHSPGGVVSGKPLDSYSNVRNFISPGNAASSRLIQAIDGGSMSGRLTGDEIDLFEEWIDQGAKE